MSEAVQTDDLSRQIAILDVMKAEIASIENVEDAKEMRDQAEALRTYAKAAGKSLELQNKCAEIRLRLERRTGELLIQQGIGRGNPQLAHYGPIGRKPTLRDLGIDHHKSTKWKQIAGIPLERFEDFLANMKENLREITTAAALRLKVEVDREERRAEIDPAVVFPKADDGEVIHGEMEAQLPLQPPEIADLILTDPPFGLGATADIQFADRENMSKPAGEWDHEGIVESFHVWARLFRRAVKQDGSLYVFVADMFIGKLWDALEDHGFLVQEVLVWSKLNPPPSVRKSGWRSDIEYILYATSGDTYTFNYLGDSRMKKHIECAVCGGHERLDHPTQKPVKLLKTFIEVSSNEGDLVLDPFAGVGSTGTAARELGRRYILVEKDEYYYKQACQRLQTKPE